ncbi:hypothetical protein N800_05060 [Lysobacter daejeonensis GH1-9]|uniref:Uncharacterized protein n=1 Tax=Lysobacter daejeonensis GH1-9 TaxID=1385517 RepID=A0A0A0EVW2_9GAMM|nr:hypothetical protein N800_05060 [Lysobacter daejeonensis GH1-9]
MHAVSGRLHTLLLDMLRSFLATIIRLRFVILTALLLFGCHDVRQHRGTRTQGLTKRGEVAPKQRLLRFGGHVQPRNGHSIVSFIQDAGIAAKEFKKLHDIRHR